MQVVEMRMSDEHQIDGRKIIDSDPRPPQSFQDKQPAREVWINHDVFSADLQEKSGMANESDTQLAIGNKFGLMRFANARGDGGMPYELPKLLGALAQSRIFERLFQHEVQLLAVSSQLERFPKLKAAFILPIVHDLLDPP